MSVAVKETEVPAFEGRVAGLAYLTPNPTPDVKG
jgi:hypothetical protein